MYAFVWVLCTHDITQSVPHDWPPSRSHDFDNIIKSQTDCSLDCKHTEKIALSEASPASIKTFYLTSSLKNSERSLSKTKNEVPIAWQLRSLEYCQYRVTLQIRTLIQRYTIRYTSPDSPDTPVREKRTTRLRNKRRAHTQRTPFLSRIKSAGGDCPALICLWRDDREGPPPSRRRMYGYLTIYNL